MTRRGPSRAVGARETGGRRENARAFLKAAQRGLGLIGDESIANHAVSNICLAAVAYADALTAHFCGRINQKDHAAAVKLLRSALGDAFPQEQETRLRRILEAKNDAQYGARAMRKGEALRLLADLEKFAAWAEARLSGG